MGHGFAVVDLETTGLSPERGHRIVEIAVVHVSPDGKVEGTWETLVNPRRSAGGGRVHGISTRIASQAPTFDRVAPGVAQLLAGRVPVAHNADFDAMFLHHEMQQIGLPVAPRTHWICTMQLAETCLPGHRSLRECCRAIGVPVPVRGHHAVHDAEATARLLAAYLDMDIDGRWWRGWLASADEDPPESASTDEWMPRGAVPGDYT